ncbi:MAG: DUF262 domain-containing protein [Gemmatimonas sp.]|jgi:hypothetical protein
MTTLSGNKEQDGEEPEGVETTGPDGWGDYPLDSVFVRTETRSVAEVVKRIEAGRYVLDPDFQRDFVWETQKQSKLIESAVMRIPLPVFYVAEAPDGRIIVVDGLQRLTTFSRFLGNQLRLSGLASGEDGKGSHALEGKYYRDLPLNLQERVQDTQLTMYILDAKAPERARLDIFERVNSGVPLTRQQMRNALYNGPATDWLRRAASSIEFQRATSGSLSAKTMRDREAINRFCAFRLLGWQSYRTGDMDAFLADGLRRLAGCDTAKRDYLYEDFRRVMQLNREMFEGHAFRKSLARPKYGRTVINISLFEVCAVTMSDRSVITVSNDEQPRIRDVVIKLLEDPQFDQAITYSTNSTNAVHHRFAAMQKALAEALIL